MTTFKIKGSCENCGFAHKGTVKSKDKSFPRIECPSCHQETENFEEAHTVDEQDKWEGTTFDYKASKYKIIA